MKTPKGLIRIDGMTMVDRIASTLKNVASEIILIANDSSYCECNYPMFGDLIMDKGPAAGIHSALYHSLNERVIIVSCDVPFVSVELLEFLLAQEDQGKILIPVHDGKVEPLIAVYRKSMYTELQQCIVDGQTRLQDILISLQAKFVEVPAGLFPEQEFFNINTPGDLFNAFPQSSTS